MVFVHMTLTGMFDDVFEKEYQIQNWSEKGILDFLMDKFGPNILNGVFTWNQLEEGKFTLYLGKTKIYLELRTLVAK